MTWQNEEPRNPPGFGKNIDSGLLSDPANPRAVYMYYKPISLFCYFYGLRLTDSHTQEGRYCLTPYFSLGDK
jgi:hypothetical protein